MAPTPLSGHPLSVAPKGGARRPHELRPPAASHPTLGRVLHLGCRTVSALVLAYAAVLADGIVQPIRAQGGPGDIQDLVAAIRAASNPQPFTDGPLLSPDEEGDPEAPLTALEAIVTDIRSLTPGRDGAGHLPPRSRVHVTAAARHASAARDAFGASEPLFGHAFESIAASLQELDQVREPQGRRFQSELDELSRRLAGVARRIAADAVAVAVAAGASTAARAQALVAAADDDVALGLYGPAVGAYGDALAAAGGGVVLDLDLLEENIRGALNGETVGYAYVIATDGTVYATSEGVGGLARRPVDPDETPQSPAKEMYIASMSKTISATALLKALHDAGISVDEAIGAYLPADWVLGEDLDLVTFRHLLTHTSGLDAANVAAGGMSPQTDASLQTIIANGSDDTQRGNHNYRNANYSLMRILIPWVVYGPLVDQLAEDWPRDAVHAGLYEYYVSQNVLVPAGISQNQCQPTESATTRTLLYPLSPDTANGVDAGDWSLSSGATGWFLSALDLGSFLAHLRFTNDILTPQTRTLMDTGYLGWLDPIAYATWVQGTWGTYRAHAGDWTNMTGCIMNFPSAANPVFPGVKVQVSLLVNSTGGTLGTNLPVVGPRRICKVLKVAYDEAWVGN